MSFATWLAIAILGPGAIAIFIWFLRDLRKILGEAEPEAEQRR